MRNSRILTRIRAGQPARIAYLSHYIPMLISTAAQTGYDGLWLDLEHAPMDQREVQALLALCHHYDIDAMVRPSTREKASLYRYLEDGAAGLLIPHVNSVDEARDLVRKVKFPPLGDRGIAGFGLEANYSFDIEGSPLDLIEHAQRETFLFVQIETPGGLAHVEAIAAIPGIDGLYIGSLDLSVRMAYLPEDERVSMDDAVARIAAAAQAHDKPWGIFASSLDVIRSQAAQGAQILVWGGDIFVLKDGMRGCQKAMDDALGG